MDPICVAVGLLHDVLEDTLTTPERLQEYFGDGRAAHRGGRHQDLADPASRRREERQAETYRKMLLAMVDDIRVILVKLADRLHNMRTLQHLPEERQKRIARETLDIYAPIAGRLGMGKIKNELEDLAFRYLDKPGLRRARAAGRGPPQAGGRLHREDPERRRPRTCARPASRPRSRAASSACTRSSRSSGASGSTSTRSTTSSRSRILVDERRRLLRGARRAAQHLAPGAGAHQGLHRDAAPERLPVAPHLGDLATTATRSRSRSAPTRCTGSPRRASPRTGSTRKAAPASTRTTTPSPGCGSCSSGSRRSRTRTSS